VGVVDQGGDGYGAAQAFAAAGKPRPTIIMGNRQDELQWWKEQKEKDGYKTWSASIAPGVSTLAFWVAQQVLDGNKKMPHDLLVPYLSFTQDNFEAELPNIPTGGVASHEYTQADAIAAIKANMK
jgi:ribose transport system substrate-binding protein